MKTQQEKLAKWLNKLQQESWQLELIISGFAIFLLVGALSALDGMSRSLFIASQGLGSNDSLLNIGYGLVYGACIFILVNLIMHVFLRGIWISTLGLRYVSGDIDIDSLGLSPKFDRFLNRKIGSFDKFILRLENLCSVVFAFTFLIVFMLVALGMYLAFVIVLFNVVLDGLVGGISESFLNIIEVPLLIFLLVAGLIYFIDFLTLGWLKRIKWFALFYYPIYRFLSLITLSFLYRPIYYNLIDNKFGRRIGYLLVPYTILVILAYFTNIDSHGWYPDSVGDKGFVNNYYDDLREEEKLVVAGSIPSKFIKNGFVELFISYWPSSDNANLKKLCPDFKPFRESGLANDITFDIGKEIKTRSQLATDTALVCFSSMYNIIIDDSVYNEPPFRFRRHPNYGEYGVMTMIDVHYLQRGEHLISVEKKDLQVKSGRDTLVLIPHFQIPFWVE